MPSEILHVGAEFDVGPLVSGAQQAGVSIEQMADKIKASGLSAQETASALVNLGYAEEAAAKAAGIMAPATERVAAATQSMAGSMGVARIAAGEMTGSVGMITGGMARLAAQSEILAPLLQAAFAPIIVIAFGEILLQMGEKAYKAYENIVLLKSSIEALDKATMAEAEHAAALNYQYEEGLARRLEAQGHLTEAANEYKKAAADKPLELPKIDDKMFKQFNSDFVSFLQSVHTTAEAPSVITRINAEAGSTQEQLDKAKKTLEGMSEISGEALAYGGAAAIERQTKLVQDLSDKVGFLKGIIGEVQSQQGIASDQELTRQAAVGKKEDEAATRRQQEIVAYQELITKNIERQAAAERVANENATIAREETILFETEAVKRGDKEAEITAKALQEEQKRKEQGIAASAQLAEQDIQMQESAAEHEARMQELRVSGSTLSAGTKARLIGDIQASELAQLQDFENQKYAVELDAKKKELELAMGGQTQQEFFSGGASPEQLTQYARIKNEMAELDAKHATASQTLNDRIMESGLQAAIKIQHAWDSAASSIASNYNSAFNQIMNGTMTVGRAFENMAAHMVNSVVLHLQDLVIKWAAHEIQMVVIHATANEAKVASDAAAAGQSKAISASESLKEIGHAAAVAAAKTWAAVSAIPIVGPVLAPVAAAAAFAGVLGFEALATAQQGAVLPANQLVYAHQNEMILPAHLSQGIQSMIESGQGGGGHTFNIGMINTASPQDFMKQLKTMAKRGQLRI